MNEAAHRSRYYVGLILFFVALTFLIYLPSLHYGFLFDDVANISKNYNIRHYTLGQLFFSGTRWISYWINALLYSVGKFDPFYYRVFSVLLHCLNGLLVFTVCALGLCRVRSNTFFKQNALSISALSAFLFLLHPVHTMTISYVIQAQLEGMASCMMLSMIALFLLAHTIKHTWFKLFVYTAIFLLGVLSCGTKEITIVGPLLILITDWFCIAQANFKELKGRLPFHIALHGLVGSMYLYLMKPAFFLKLFGLKITMQNNLGNVLTQQLDEPITPLHFFISQFKVILHYLWIFIFPFKLSIEYDWKLVHHFVSPDCLVPFLILVGIVYFMYRRLKKSKTDVVVFGLLWFFICMLPRSSIMPSTELVADYKTYLASAGWLMIISSALVWMYQKIKPISVFNTKLIRVSVLVIGACSLMAVTYKQNSIWRSGLAFWAHMVNNAPGKARAWNNYGVELALVKKYKEAIPYYQHAIAMDPYYRDPYTNLAVCHGGLKDFDAGIEVLKKVLYMYPNHAEAHNNIGSFYIEKKEFTLAERSFDMAIALRPHYGKAHYNKGRLYIMTEQPEKAYESFKKCCTEADLDTGLGFGCYGKIALQLKKYDEAIFAYTRAIECDPRKYEYAFQLANAHFFNKNYDEAEQMYHQLLQAQPHEGRICYNIAECRYQKDDYTGALSYYERIQSDKDKLPSLYARIADCYERLGNYQKGRAVLQAAYDKSTDSNIRSYYKQRMNGIA